MHAKDKAYASLEAAFFRETKSAPTSPPNSPIKPSFIETQPTTDLLVRELKKENEKLKAELEQSKKQDANKIQILEKDLRELTEKHAQNVSQSEERWKNMYMAENKEITMRAEARVDNLLVEHKQAIHDINEAHKHEQHIIDIKHQTQMEKVIRELKKSRKEKATLSQQYSNVSEKVTLLFKY